MKAIPPYGQKPAFHGIFNQNEVPLIRKWLKERVAIGNLVEAMNRIPCQNGQASASAAIPK